MVTQKTLYHDAQRVVDEDGKGAEVLRQQNIPDQGSGTHIMLVAEVDCIVRSAYVVSADSTAVAAGSTVQIWKRTPGAAASVALSASHDLFTDLGVGAQYTMGEVPITDGRVSKGDVVYVGVGTLTSSARVTLHLGWMPSIWQEDDFRSYVTPQ
jgi:hypothetical protein